MKRETSFTRSERPTRSMSKLRASIDSASRISRNARERPGQMRGPSPNAKSACRAREASEPSQRSGSKAATLSAGQARCKVGRLTMTMPPRHVELQQIAEQGKTSGPRQVVECSQSGRVYDRGRSRVFHGRALWRSAMDCEIVQTYYTLRPNSASLRCSPSSRPGDQPLARTTATSSARVQTSSFRKIR